MASIINNEELDDLLADLRRRGFDDEQLAGDIRKAEAYGLPTFAVNRKKQFGEEKMDYRLFFKWNDEVLKFELTQIAATHRQPIDIEERRYNGFNTLKLDKEMAQIDWKEYWFYKKEGLVLPPTMPSTAGIIDQLAQFLLSEDNYVKLAADELMYKHFPPEMYAVFSKDPQRFAGVHEHHFTFTLTSYPDITAEIAYYIISERFDSLETKVEEFTAGLVPAEAIRNEIHSKLNGAPKQTELSFAFLSGNNSVEITIPVSGNKGWYEPHLYRVSLTPLPEIPHGIFNNVDSQRLDKKMATVDWTNDEEMLFAHKHKIEMPRDIELMQEELFRMSLDPEGKKVADLLMLKHYLHVPFFEDQISKSALELFEELPKRSAQFLAGIPLDKAINLVAGRPVMISSHIENSGQTNWQRLGFTADGRNGTLVGLVGISEPELEKMIAMLPVHMYDAPDIEKGLKQGDIVKAEAKTGIPITILVTENATGIKILDRSGREIPFNFQLDPDWIPEKNVIAEQQIEPGTEEKRTPKIRLNNKYKKGL